MHRVVIVGRPNVGKSSLFNRLLGLRQPTRALWAGSQFSVVANVPGVTRDLKEGVVESEQGRFKLVDTGGLWSGDGWEEKIRQKVEKAIQEADLVLFVVDGRADLAPADLEVADFLRRQGKPVLLVATKVDDPKHEAYLGELYALGFGEALPTSAAHGRGIEELIERVWAHLPVRQEESEPEVVPIRLAIVGRPNAGKSSLLNAILGEERVIVSDIPGTTRDAVDVAFDYGGTRFLLVDTAGIRKRPESGVEEQAILRAHQAIREADVVLLVVDPWALGDHELKLAQEALEAGKPVVVAITKWDRVKDREEAKRLRAELSLKLVHIQHLPRVYVSSVTKANLHKLLAEAARLFELARTRFETSELNRWLSVWSLGTQLPNFRGKPLKLFFLTQPEVAPPTFVFFCNYPEFVTRAFEGYLRNRIGEDLGLREIPFRLVFRGRRERAST
ncbi:ribosome biogenesis GTPase Der [Meiothermus sp. QL-1]|uniref:ribosome biogenesis GTPase Der n=1 Tax=Meiothermus sp. QL-1 TaxID=2058095 RepID=UPI000E0B81B0|nr:ribosome biogenesis GTPase Der [Meiothermus sp. QL-1]RDI95054.1 ribosome biogenesis GTPase Der [Meiothermus sp. QL-1]